VTDCDASKIKCTLPDDLDTYCVSTRIRAARNISGYGLVPGCSRSERRAVEALCKDALDGLDGDLTGKYISLSDLSADDAAKLEAEFLLFKKPGPDTMIAVSGGLADWPESRGIYHNDDKNFLIWVNEEDQIRFTSMQKGGNLPQVFARFAAGVNGVEKGLGSKGKRYMVDDHIGQFSSCISNIGTGLRASMHMLLPKTVEALTQDGLENLCRGNLDLHCRAVEGAEGRVDISNKTTIGKSEVELIQAMIDGVLKLVDLEKKAAAGDDIKPLVEAME